MSEYLKVTIEGLKESEGRGTWCLYPEETFVLNRPNSKSDEYMVKLELKKLGELTIYLGKDWYNYTEV